MTMAKTTQNPLIEVVKLGQSLWYDGLIGRAEFERMIREDGLRGATTNPVIFEKALAGDAGKLRELKALSDEQNGSNRGDHYLDYERTHYIDARTRRIVSA